MNLSNTSRVVLFDGDRSEFVLHELPKYQPASDEVLVRVACCTICGSDVHTYSGRRHSPSPAILGHEIVGIVESWGGETPPSDYYGNPIKRCQRITWCLTVGCSCCKFCCDGLPQKCTGLFKYGHGKFEGKPIGGLSDHCVLAKDTAIFPVPDSLSNEIICPANCATATVMAAIRMARQVRKLESANVLITGLGALGLTASAVCAAEGCNRIAVVDPIDARRKLARQFGATEMYAPETTRDLLENFEFDVALEFSGSKSAIDLCFSALSIGGVAILAGSVFPGENVLVDPETMVRKILTVRGIHNYRPQDLKSAIEFLSNHAQAFPFESLVSKQFSLEETAKAFQAASTGDAIRVAVWPSRDD